MATIIKRAEGFTAIQAYKQTNLNIEIMKNATKAWRIKGSPKGEDFEKFANDYIERNMKGRETGMFYVITSNPVKNTKNRPYSVENFITDGKRSYTTGYELVGKKSNKKYETVVGKKSLALSVAKKYVAQYQEDIDLNIVKVCTEGVSKVATVSYKPSQKTFEGSFIFFGKISGVQEV